MMIYHTKQSGIRCGWLYHLFRLMILMIHGLRFSESFLENKRIPYQFHTNHNHMSTTRGGSRMSIVCCYSLNPKRLALPLIGPIINAPPLLLGTDIKLNPPTPLQWKALQESVVVHQHSLNQQQEDITQDTATIKAAPLILIIDEKSGIRQVPTANSQAKESGRYATIVAIVGVNTKAKIDTEQGFMNYNNNNNNDMIIPMESSVRLVAVGRAVLKDYFYRIPTNYDETGSGELRYRDFEDLPTKDEFCSFYEEEDDDDDDDEEEYYKEDCLEEDEFLDKTPIVMAEFEPLLDDASLYANDETENKHIGNKGVKSARSSPVHAISSLHQTYMRVNYIHEDRRRLVAGLIAAKARLHFRRKNTNAEMEYYDDYDGLGLIGQTNNNNIDDIPEYDEEEMGMSITEFLDRFQGKSDTVHENNEMLEKVASLENYGVNYFGAFSTISDLTSEAVKTLNAYYSPTYRDREEFELEIASFVTFRALEGFANTDDIVWALQCTSTNERLERAYQIMIDHRIQLQTLAELVSEELRNCGEECTDLW